MTALRFVGVCALAWVPALAQAWGNHSALCYRAFERMPEVSQAAPVAAEPLEAFLREQEAAIERSLQAQEVWAQAHLPKDAQRPQALRFKADAQRSDAARRAAFLRALRLAPDSRLPLYVQPDPRDAVLGLPRMPAQAVTTVEPGAGDTQRYLALAAGASVAPLTVLASACDEPDYGLDLRLFDDNPGHPTPSYGFGPQPFGNPKLVFGSQAPFHMGFFHEGLVFNTLAPSFTRNFVELRIQQYSALAVLAWQTGHDYWGWRFAGWALHYVQDLTQPYHASAAPGAGLPSLVWAQAKAAVGLPAGRQALIVLQSNRHLVLEYLQTHWLFDEVREPRIGVIERALQELTPDTRYPAWSERYVRQVVSQEAFDAGPMVDATLEAAVPARFVADPALDFGADEAHLGPELAQAMAARRLQLEPIVVMLMTRAAAHSRNGLRGFLLQAGRVQK